MIIEQHMLNYYQISDTSFNSGILKVNVPGACGLYQEVGVNQVNASMLAYEVA